MWHAYLFEVMTGRVGARIEFENSTWSVSLNDIENFKIECLKSALPRVSREWLTPWKSGMILMYKDVVVCGGPLIAFPQESRKKVHLEFRGIRRILGDRYIVPEMADWTNLGKQVVSFNNMSLGTIAKRVVEHAQNKPAGKLPITYAVPDQFTGHERNYKSFNLSTISADAILTKLSEASQGPDIMFKPRLLDTSRITFDMWNGTELDPRIAQKYELLWDTSENLKSDVVDFFLTETAAYQASRVFALGAGTDESKLISVATNTTRQEQGFPFLEKVVTSDTEFQGTLDNVAYTQLYSNEDSLQEFTMVVRADGANPMGTFWPGDMVKLVIRNMMRIPDGIHNARLLNMSGTESTDIRLSLQLEPQSEPI